VTGFRFAELVRRLERRLVNELGLEPCALPAELVRLEGKFRGEPATLQARAYAGRRLAYVRCVEVASRDLDIGNVLGVPRVEFALPLLGIDLVEVGRDTAVVVADLSPMTDELAQRAHQRDVLAQHRPSLVNLGTAIELPAWAAECFSSDALSARIDPEQAGASESAVDAYVAAFIQLVRDGVPSPARAELTAQRQRAYTAAHRERDRGLLLLRRIFEPSLADRFLGEVLFPEQVPA